MESSFFKTFCLIVLLFLYSSSFSDVVINEIQYHPINDPEEEFVELYNTGSESVNLTGWQLSDGIRFVFPEGTTILPGGFLVIAKDEAHFKRAYPGWVGTSVLFGYSGKLSNKGERIALLRADGTVADEVTYDDKPPWNPDADGSGPSLECISPMSPNDDYRNWEPSTNANFKVVSRGTPGRANSVRQSGVPPFILEVSHFPLVPLPGEQVVVTALLDGTEEESVTLYYQAAKIPFPVSGKTYNSIEMKYNGEFKWKKKIFRRYGAVVPGHTENTMVRYFIKARGENGAVRRFPHGSSEFGRGWLVADSSEESYLPRDMLLMYPEDIQKIYLNPNDEDLSVIGSYIHNGELFDNVIISLRGRSARSFPKKAWKVRLPKSHTLEGGRRIINLNSDYHDASHIRNALSMEVYSRLGVPVPEIEFVRLYINERYSGVYYRIEQLNTRWLRSIGRDDDYGELYQSHHSESLPASPSLYPYLYEKKSGRDKSDYSAIQRFVEELNARNPKQRGGFLRSVFRIENLINYCVARTLVSNAEDWHKNHYLFLNPPDAGGRWEIFPWDNDLTWGHIYSPENGLLNDDFITTQPSFYNVDGNPLFCAVRDDPELRAEYYRRLYQALQDDFTETIWWQRIDELYSAIREDVLRDPDKWEDNGRFVSQIEQLKKYVELRRKYLLERDIPPEYIPSEMTNWYLY